MANWQDAAMDELKEYAAIKAEGACDETAAAKVRWIERGLSVLTDIERLGIQTFFIERDSRRALRLFKGLGYEKTEACRVRDDALKLFTLSRFGVIDL